jgi:3-phenylpropionate/cinnamic acid dioxygenase small subunit
MPDWRLLQPIPEILRSEFAEACVVVENEGLFLDEARWHDWLGLFSDDVRYWVPAWRSDGRLTADPEMELSQIFYDGRAALEDRVTRFTSPDSPASNPAPRTTHLFSCFRLLEGSKPGSIHIRSSWVTHIFFPQRKAIHALFGSQRHTVISRDSRWLIREKTVVIVNDYIPTMLDVYCL